VTFEHLSDEELIDLTEVIGQKFYDLVGEKERRGLVAQRPSTVVAFEIKRLRARVVAHHELGTLSAAAIAESAGGPVCRICERAVADLGAPSEHAWIVGDPQPPGWDADGSGAA